MKILYTQEIDACHFVEKTLETEKVIRTSGELIGKNSDGQLVHINIDNLIKITD